MPLAAPARSAGSSWTRPSTALCLSRLGQQRTVESGGNCHSDAMRGTVPVSPDRPTKIVLRRSLESAQYTSIEFGHRCRDAGVRPSMGSVGDAYDNAMCESFFATLECELLDRCRFKTQVEARHATFAFIEGFYNGSSQRTSRYVVEEKRFCWATSGNAGCLGWVWARRARSRAAALSRSARLKIQGPSSRGCIASISPRSAASRRVRGATPTMAAASPRLSQGSSPSAASQYTGIR